MKYGMCVALPHKIFDDVAAFIAFCACDELRAYEAEVAKEDVRAYELDTDLDELTE